jgi:hypothetical protein
MARDTIVIDALSKRIAYFRKAFARGLGRKPSALESAAMMRAARLTALAEAAALDLNTNANDLVRLDNVAQRARREMEATLVAKREPDDGATDLDRYLQRRAAEGARES